jgi:hypothetical protein
MEDEFNMNIPTSIISRMQIKNISHNPEIDFQTVTVEFTNLHPVNTIFKYVKNLAPEQKVSIYIPDILAPKNENLKNHSYQLRNGPIKYKTVIKYVGNDIALYARKTGDRPWNLVTSPPQLSQLPLNTYKNDDDPKKTETIGNDVNKSPIPNQTPNSGNC